MYFKTAYGQNKLSQNSTNKTVKNSHVPDLDRDAAKESKLQHDISILHLGYRIVYVAIYSW